MATTQGVIASNSHIIYKTTSDLRRDECEMRKQKKDALDALVELPLSHFELEIFFLSVRVGMLPLSNTFGRAGKFSLKLTPSQRWYACEQRPQYSLR